MNHRLLDRGLLAVSGMAVGYGLGAWPVFGFLVVIAAWWLSWLVAPS